MATYGVKPLRVSQQSQRVVTADNAYWHRMQTVATIGEPSNVTSVAISPDAPYQVAAASSTRVAFYSASTGGCVHRLTRFKQAATCVAYRHDGALVAVGGEEGALRLYDARQQARSALRQFAKAHSGCVRQARFSAAASAGAAVYTCGDDNAVRRWHVGREQCDFDTDTGGSGHGDFVRALDASDVDEHVVVSGSYDHQMKVWDCRLPKEGHCVAVASHGHPIEAVLAYPAARMVATAGGNVVKIWDVSRLSNTADGGAQPLATLQLHHKTVTALAWASKRSRLCTGSLDRHIKVVDVATMLEVHSLECAAPVLAMDIAKNDEYLSVGMAGAGLLAISRRMPEQREEAERRRLAAMTGRHRKAVKRMNTLRRVEGETEVKVERRPQLAKHDQLLRAFKHSEALTNVLIYARSSTPVLAVLRELDRRGALRTAIAGRTGGTLAPLLFVCRKNMSRPGCMAIIRRVAEIVVDTYSGDLSELLDDRFVAQVDSLAGSVHEELRCQDEMHRLVGQIDMIVNAAHT